MQVAQTLVTSSVGHIIANNWQTLCKSYIWQLITLKTTCFSPTEARTTQERGGTPGTLLVIHILQVPWTSSTWQRNTQIHKFISMLDKAIIIVKERTYKSRQRTTDHIGLTSELARHVDTCSVACNNIPYNWNRWDARTQSQAVCVKAMYCQITLKNMSK